MTIKEEQEILLDLLKKTHDFCEENGLRYCLTYGTLIGAVRHQGFIPWDNDVDIFMPRPDYEKFWKMTHEKPIADYIKCTNYRDDPKNHYSVIRVCNTKTKIYLKYLREQPTDMGIFLDIFPVDGIWDDSKSHWLWRKKLRFNQRLQVSDLYGQRERKGWKKKLRSFLPLIFRNKNNIHEYKIDEYAMMCDYETHEKVIDIAEYQHFNTYLTHEDFDHPLKMPFEQYVFNAPQRYHEFLTAGYGDYMQLPPEEKREVHDFDVELV
ncbi:MAG: LicD family protein [Lachnospiraceae bacterium]|nr:LicD family protein [Lachnospiraceae bacterium]